mgnify:CR=1 FL=1
MPLMRLFALLAWLLAGLASPAAALDLPGLAQDASAYAAILLEGAPPQENPAARDAALARARAAAGAGNWAGAVAAYEQAIARGDRQSATWLSLSEALERAAGPPNLQRALQAAYQAYSAAMTPAESGAALLRMGRLLDERLNRPAQALEAYREAAQQAPGSPGLAERIRAGGAGIPAFYTATGVGTPVAAGKEIREFYRPSDDTLHQNRTPTATSGTYSSMATAVLPRTAAHARRREYVLETGLYGDLALVKAWKADEFGNLIYRKTARNFNPMMATAATFVIAEVEEIVPVGQIDGDAVHTPGNFINRIVKTTPEKRIEQRTVRKG